MLIDANIFLEIILEQERAEKCKEFLRPISEGKKTAFICTFSIDAIIFSMLRNNISYNAIRTFISSLGSYEGLRFYIVTLKDRLNALALMEKYKLDYEDAITLQSCLSCKCKEIVSFDKHFNKVNEINRIEP